MLNRKREKHVLLFLLRNPPGRGFRASLFIRSPYNVGRCSVPPIIGCRYILSLKPRTWRKFLSTPLTIPKRWMTSTRCKVSSRGFESNESRNKTHLSGDYSKKILEGEYSGREWHRWNWGDGKRKTEREHCSTECWHCGTGRVKNGDPF